MLGMRAQKGQSRTVSILHSRLAYAYCSPHFLHATYRVGIMGEVRWMKKSYLHFC
jgi:hypothetical protein